MPGRSSRRNAARRGDRLVDKPCDALGARALRRIAFKSARKQRQFNLDAHQQAAEHIVNVTRNALPLFLLHALKVVLDNPANWARDADKSA